MSRSARSPAGSGSSPSHCWSFERSRFQADDVDFARDVRPILEAKCSRCHGPKKQQSDFRLDEKARAFRGGSEGLAIVPGKPDESPLVARIASDRPRGGHAPQGGEADRPSRSHSSAPGSTRGRTGPTTPRAKADALGVPGPDPPGLPKVEDEAWPRNPIDRFILARLEAEGLRPSPEADRATLIRRLSLDLIGLPPTPEEVDAFVADTVAGRLREGWSTGSWPARTTASAGAGTGSTPPATPTPTASRRTRPGTSGSIATGSSTPSTATCPTTTSSSSRSPATCCRARPRTRSSRPASSGTR